MANIIMRVRETAAGWLVEDGRTFGPFASREQAMNLAFGMAQVLKEAGESASVEIENQDDGTSE